MPNKFVQTLEKAPRVPVILGSIGITVALAGLFSSIAMARGEKPMTITKEWQQANKEYMKFQKNNPIFGVSKGL